MTSSVRAVPLVETLARAQAMSGQLGISRVTDTTWLDRVGIPVFASIRPTAVPGSLCVNAGKGVHAVEAQVGAYMEAIEYALAEYDANRVEIVKSTPRVIGLQPNVDWSFLDLCPTIGQKVDGCAPIACVEADVLFSDERVLVPAELVFFPSPADVGQQVFGAGTNGLCSGNTVDEATLHGLAEVLERDVQAFNFVEDQSELVELDASVGDARGLAERVEAAGMQAVLRYTSNAYGLPYFEGYILESSDDDPVPISYGAGLHLIRDIAAVRALTEAAQSRLSTIHGGRDDLIERVHYFTRFDRPHEKRALGDLRHRVNDPRRSIRYSTVPSSMNESSSIDAMLRELAERLRAQGITQVLRVVLSPPDSPLAVVRVIVPKLESFKPPLTRVGPRLARALDRDECP